MCTSFSDLEAARVLCTEHSNPNMILPAAIWQLQALKQERLHYVYCMYVESYLEGCPNALYVR